jgi:riboflavin synthase
MGGHILLGHVDGIGRVVSRETIASSVRLALAIPAALERFLASKGSIGVDGVSLTVNRVGERRGDMFELDLMLVPHTLGRTLLGSLRPGDALNVEVDVLARYVARQLDLGAAATDHAEVPPQPRDPPPTGQPDEPILSALRAGGFL